MTLCLMTQLKSMIVKKLCFVISHSVIMVRAIMKNGDSLSIS